MDNIEQQIKDIYNKKEKGKMVFLTGDGVYEQDFDSLLKMNDIDSFLYDINRLPEVIVTNAKANPKSQRWVNDLALVFALKYLKERYNKLLEHYQSVSEKWTKLYDKKYGDKSEVKRQDISDDVFTTGKNIGV